jgi:trans-2,3-dihydro-3-hydroxyanthranilate isomerase
MRRRFVMLDVFTNRRFAGNPLAVVLDPEGLDAATMQAIAREFNLSETVFVLPPAERSHRARVRMRIFTPAMEIPFAGHPTVGTAVLIGRIDRKSACEIVLEEEVGNVWCVVEALGADRGRASFDLPRLPSEIGPAAPVSELAAALTIDARDIGFDRFVPMCWSAGADYTFVPVRGLDAIRACRADLAHWNAIDRRGPSGAFVFCRETVERGNAFHARMFAPSFGITEDPATGSAVAAFAGVLVRCEGLGDGRHPFGIEQGYEMGRPSLIELSLSVQDGKLSAAAIGGEAVMVSEGTTEA